MRSQYRPSNQPTPMAPSEAAGDSCADRARIERTASPRMIHTNTRALTGGKNKRLLGKRTPQAVVSANPSGATPYTGAVKYTGCTRP